MPNLSVGPGVLDAMGRRGDEPCGNEMDEFDLHAV